MKKLWTAAAGFAALGFAALSVAPATAADMAVKAPPPAPIVAIYNWIGFYIGGGQEPQLLGLHFAGGCDAR